MQRQLEECSEIIQTMVEVEAEDKDAIRKLSKSVEMLNILVDQYDAALQTVEDLLPQETSSIISKLRERRSAVPLLQSSEEQRKPLVRPSDQAINKANTKRVAAWWTGFLSTQSSRESSQPC